MARQSNVSQVEPVKRKPGRPRKHPLPDTDLSVSERVFDDRFHKREGSLATLFWTWMIEHLVGRMLLIAVTIVIVIVVLAWVFNDQPMRFYSVMGLLILLGALIGYVVFLFKDSKQRHNRNMK